jgi:phosphoribosylformylglycinamidine cyclo-ligase
VEKHTYKDAGVDIDAAMSAKSRMSAFIDSGDSRVLNRLGAFASLVTGVFSGVEEPVLVLKMEEPGSKQSLAIRHGRFSTLGQDLINHLINDVSCMGAEPLAVLDTIVCGHLDPDVIVPLVQSMAEACREHGCSLVGGETSEQPTVVPPGRYVLSASAFGVVAKNHIVDGTKIERGAKLIALASNGLHTNGYTLVNKLLESNPDLAGRSVADESFLEWALRPHTSYLRGIRQLFGHASLLGLAHITGGGIRDNVERIIPDGLCAEIDLQQVRVLPVFHAIRDEAGLDDEEMLKTFNIGVGLVAVVRSDFAVNALEHFHSHGYDAYEIGHVIDRQQIEGQDEKVTLKGRLQW